jgi:hypothetical protein
MLGLMAGEKSPQQRQLRETPQKLFPFPADTYSNYTSCDSKERGWQHGLRLVRTEDGRER